MLLVQTTVPSRKQAERIASALVKESLASCATFFPTTSLFHWQGLLRKEHEFVLELKVKNSNYGKAEKRILSLHPYSLPQVIAIPIKAGYGRYVKWVEK